MNNLNSEPEQNAPKPSAAATGSAIHGATYQELDDANAALCAENSRLRVGLERILRFPVHSEPVGSAYAMQDIAHETLLPNVRLSDGGPATTKLT